MMYVMPITVLASLALAFAVNMSSSSSSSSSSAAAASPSSSFTSLLDASSSTPSSILTHIESLLLTTSYLSYSFDPSSNDTRALALVSPLLTSLTAAQLSSYPNVERWYRAVSTSSSSSSLYPARASSLIYELDIIECAKADAKLRASMAVAAVTAVGKKGPNTSTVAAVPASGVAPVAAAKASKAAASGPGVKAAAPAAVVAAAPVVASAAPIADASAPAVAAPAVVGDKKVKAPKVAKVAAVAAAVVEVSQVYRVDFRVGRILSAAAHPTEARMIVSQVDCGSTGGGGVRTVVSGIADFFTPASLVDRLVIVMVNVKSGDIKGVESAGRTMVATSADGTKKELASPPAGSLVGEPITFPGIPADQKPDGVLAPKRLHEIMKGLHVNADRVVQYEALSFTTTAGVVTAETIASGTVA